jgi:hypothetical protein
LGYTDKEALDLRRLKLKKEVTTDARNEAITKHRKNTTRVSYLKLAKINLYGFRQRFDNRDWDGEHDHTVSQRQDLGSVHAWRQLSGIHLNVECATIVHQHEMLWRIHP